GRTAVGLYGGKVEGPGGLQLRLPEGALERGVVFKLEQVSPATIPVEKRPDLPGASLAAAVRIVSDDKPAFKKEVDLVFAKPAEAPAGAFFYVYRQLQGPNGKIINQTIDKGVVEGDRVITASPPFSGYLDSTGAYGFTPAGQAATWAVANNIAILMWTFDELLPGKASAAVFSGRVTRAQWNQQTHTYDFVPVPGALVRRVQVQPEPQDPLGDAVGTTGPDGTYTFFDSTFTGGLATVRATDVRQGQTVEATAYATTQPPWADAFRALATANLTFPPLQQPPPPPQVDIRVLVQRAGNWEFSEGIVTAGQPVAIGLEPVNGTVQRVEVNGDEVQTHAGGGQYQ
ncbi:MAG TPA: hypothetical protein VFO85_02255, partial [Vicinamibacteria bacterium]|nr:hypothetical protein [Vicinamibacteria bacterium]